MAENIPGGELLKIFNFEKPLDKQILMTGVEVLEKIIQKDHPGPLPLPNSQHLQRPCRRLVTEIRPIKGSSYNY